MPISPTKITNRQLQTGKSSSEKAVAYDKEAAKTLQSSKPKDEKFRKHSSSVALFPSPEQLWQQEEVRQRSSTPRGKGKENKPYPWVVGLPLAALATELSHGLLHS